VEQAIQVFAAVNFFVIGISHILQRSVWVEYFAKLHSLGRLGPFAEGFLYLNFGALIVSFHNVWTIPEAFLTLIGWAMVAKALMRFVAPAAVLRIYQRMRPERAWQLQLAGVLLLALSAFLIFLAFWETIPFTKNADREENGRMCRRISREPHRMSSHSDNMAATAATAASSWRTIGLGSELTIGEEVKSIELPAQKSSALVTPRCGVRPRGARAADRRTREGRSLFHRVSLYQSHSRMDCVGS